MAPRNSKSRTLYLRKALHTRFFYEIALSLFWYDYVDQYENLFYTNIQKNDCLYLGTECYCQPSRSPKIEALNNDRALLRTNSTLFFIV